MGERSDDLASAPLVAGKYRLGAMLGEGGMGAVYEAEHIGLGARVAVKFLAERFAEDEKALLRFRREARAMAAVRHDHVVRVTDTGVTDENVPFLVMELLEGESLNAVIKRSGRLKPEVAAAIACQILDGLAAAHAQGVIHRDLKPANVFLAREADGTQRAKILDFGISRYHGDVESGDITVQGALIGTPQYMPPEQVSTTPDLDLRADLYAVGVLLYRMVGGKLPFSGENPQDLYRKIINGQARPIRERVPDIDRDLEAVIQKAMAVDRENRFANAQLFREALVALFPELPRQLPTITLPPLALSDLASLSPVTAQTIPARPRKMGGGAPVKAASDPTPPTRARQGRGWRLAAIPIGLVVLFAIGWLVFRYGGWGGDGPGAGGGSPGASGTVTPGAGGEPLRFGIVAYNPSEMVMKTHQAVVDYLAASLKRPVKVVLVDAYVGLTGKLIKGEIDLAALSPGVYIKAKRQEPGIKLLAVPARPGGGSTYRGYILVRTDSPIRTLAQLKGRSFCYVSERSTSGYLYPRALFRRAGIDPDVGFFSNTIFSGHHLAALTMLYEGKCDGAAVFSDMLHDQARAHGMSPDAFHIVAGTERIPYDAYCAPKGQDPELTTALRNALLALEPGAPQTKKIFGSGSVLVGFMAAHDSDYDPVRAIERFLEKDGHGDGGDHPPPHTQP